MQEDKYAYITAFTIEAFYTIAAVQEDKYAYITAFLYCGLASEGRTTVRVPDEAIEQLFGMTHSADNTVTWPEMLLLQNLMAETQGSAQPLTFAAIVSPVRLRCRTLLV